MCIPFEGDQIGDTVVIQVRILKLRLIKAPAPGKRPIASISGHFYGGVLKVNRSSLRICSKTKKETQQEICADNFFHRNDSFREGRKEPNP